MSKSSCSSKSLPWSKNITSYSVTPSPNLICHEYLKEAGVPGWLVQEINSLHLNLSGKFCHCSYGFCNCSLVRPFENLCLVHDILMDPHVRDSGVEKHFYMSKFALGYCWLTLFFFSLLPLTGSSLEKFSSLNEVILYLAALAIVFWSHNR